MHIMNAVVIDIPIEGAFLFVEDVESYGEWSRNVTRPQVAIQRPIRVGSAISVTFGTVSRQHVFTGSVTEHEPPHAFSFEISDVKYVMIRMGWRLVDVEGRTRVSVAADVDMYKWYLHLLEVLVQDKIKGDVIGLKRLKAFAERIWRQEAETRS